MADRADTFEIHTEIRIECADCGTPLKVLSVSHDEVRAISVEPCPGCQEARFAEGWRRGGADARQR